MCSLASGARRKRVNHFAVPDDGHRDFVIDRSRSDQHRQVVGVFHGIPVKGNDQVAAFDSRLLSGSSRNDISYQGALGIFHPHRGCKLGGSVLYIHSQVTAGYLTFSL